MTSRGDASGADRVARLTELLGGVDIYLLDQLMKGRLAPGSRILDAGCGGGRNLEPLLRCGYEVFGIDESTCSRTTPAKRSLSPIRASWFCR